MLKCVCCDECGKRATEVERIITLLKISVCNECVVLAARKLGILPSVPSEPPLQLLEFPPPSPTAFYFTGELDGHLDQVYDNFLMHSIVMMLRAEYPDLAIELARVERIDGFKPEDVAEGRARYLVDLLVRSDRPVSPYSWRLVLDQKWSELTRINRKLLGDKGTRDLVEPRIMSLVTYILRRAARFGRKNGPAPE